MQTAKKNQGFTLLEVTVVIVIIGIITGSVIFGKGLLDSARLQSVITDLDTYSTASSNFKTAYMASPGDYSSATDQWGTDNRGCPTGGGAEGTCNGNGNGVVAGNEMNRFWQHLYYAGMLSQRFTGLSGSTTNVYNLIPGVNAPAGSIKGSVFGIVGYQRVVFDTPPYYFYSGSYGNAFVFGGGMNSLYSHIPILTSADAYQIDSKIDDGNGGTGNVTSAGEYYTPDCVTGALSGTYKLDSTGITCALVFKGN